MGESARHPSDGDTFAAAVVLGLEGTPTDADYDVAVQRLQRAVRPRDCVVDVDAQSIGVLCTTLRSAREIDALAARLTAVVRAPIAAGDEMRTLGVCVGSAAVTAGEPPSAAVERAHAAMVQMRNARAGLLVPEPRRPGAVAVPG